MSEDKYFFTSESVTEGHPDKVADAISDAILDAIMAQDKNCRVACETLVTTGIAFIAGEITTDCYVHMPQIVRDTIREIGYSSSQMGFDWQTCSVITSIDKQSPDIAQGVDVGKGLYKEQGAGDQGLMFGFASNENVATAVMWGMLGNILGLLFAAIADIWINGFSLAATIVGQFLPAAGPNLIFAAILVPLLVGAYASVQRQSGR